MEKVIVIVGPTASGKTALAIRVAKEFNGEIISADSMQIYKKMDIGTAKPDEKEMDGIKHYLIDEVKIGEDFSVVKFKSLALGYIKEIIEKGKMPIIVGGTGLYINSLVYNIEFSESIVDWEYRKYLEQEALEKGNQFLHHMLIAIDGEAAKRIHSNDIKRTIRALEVFKTTGKTISQSIERSRLATSEYNFFILGLTMDRKTLYDRINFRVDKMMDDGLLEEVKQLFMDGLEERKIPMQAIGYKEIIKYLKRDCELSEAVEVIKMETRRFAKRQLTWFNRLENVNWVQLHNTSSEEILKNIQDFIESKGIFL